MVSTAVPAPAPAARRTANRRRRIFSRWLTVAFFLAVLYALSLYARSIAWEPVFAALESYRWATLALGATLGTASCLLYSSFDLLTGTHARHNVARPWVIAIAFTGYTFNLNLGPLLGSFGMRLRLYSKLGVSSGQVLRMIGFTTVTNWLGYVTLAGGLFAFAAIPVIPESWFIGAGTVRSLGFALLAVAITYWGLCGFARQRIYHVRGFTFRLPSLRMALLQTSIAALNWMLIAAVPFVLLRGAVPYPLALMGLLLACAAGALAHIPGGLGVVDAVLLAILGQDIPTAEMVATLLVYRAVYYLFPFALGLITFLTLETLLRRRGPPHPPVILGAQL
jgi:glycosyltransferase 2 family protein